jgi:hypothetical protein
MKSLKWEKKAPGVGPLCSGCLGLVRAWGRVVRCWFSTADRGGFTRWNVWVDVGVPHLPIIEEGSKASFLELAGGGAEMSMTSQTSPQMSVSSQTSPDNFRKHLVIVADRFFMCKKNRVSVGHRLLLCELACVLWSVF